MRDSTFHSLAPDCPEALRLSRDPPPTRPRFRVSFARGLQTQAKKRLPVKKKVRRNNPLTCSFRGGDDGIRTHDPYVANVMLSQLSYIPT